MCNMKFTQLINTDKLLVQCKYMYDFSLKQIFTNTVS